MKSSPGTCPSPSRGDLAPIPAVEKSVRVPWSVEAAFRRFTQEIAEWWPVSTHSVGEADSETVALEGRVGGRLYETLKDGTEVDWGRIVVWEPPRRVAFTWHPGRAEETRQEVEVSFHPEGGGARVELVHTGWERIPEKPRETRDDYDNGWERVLKRYVEA